MRKLAFVVAFTILATATGAGAALTGTIIDPNGKPIKGATVAAYPLEGRSELTVRLASAKPALAPLVEGVSDSHGKFSIDVAKGTTLRLLATAAGTAPAGAIVSSDGDAGVFLLVPAATKSGRVTSSGRPVAGALVQWSADDVIVETITDEKGTYSIPDPAVWKGRLSTISHRDFATLSPPPTPLPASTLDFRLDPGVRISGTVLGTDGKTPVAGALVSIDPLAIATTGEDGKFVIEHAPRDWTRIVATSGSLAGSSGRAKGDAVIRLAPGAFVEGDVRDLGSKSPVAAAPVTLTDSRESFEAVLSTSKGTFAFGPLVPDRYALSSDPPGYSRATSTVSAGAGTRVRRTIGVEKEAAISGSVADSAAHPLGGVRLQPGIGPNRFGPAFRRGMDGAWSAPDGTFLVRMPARKDLRLRAQRRGYPDAEAGPFALAAGETKRGVAITIPTGYALTGRVLDPDGVPVRGATITASASNRESQFRRIVMVRDEDDSEGVSSDAEGRFSIQAQEGMNDVTITAPGFVRKTLSSIEVGPRTEPIEITLEPGVSIDGRVVRNGVGVPSMLVFALAPIQPVMTGADGEFVLQDLPPGNVQLSLTSPTEMVREMKVIKAPAHGVVIELPAGGTISGRVLDGETREPVKDFRISATPVGGSRRMMPGGTRGAATIHSDDGSYILEHVPAGTVDVVAGAPGYAETATDPIRVEEGKTQKDVDVLLPQAVTLHGKVTDSAGEGIWGARVVQRQRSTGGRGVQSYRLGGSTDLDGAYTIEDMAAGEVTLEFGKEGYLTETRTVKLSGKEVTLDVTLGHGRTLEGQVYTDDGAPVEGASVRAFSSTGQGSTATSDASGHFVLEGLPPERIRATARKEGFPESEPVEVDVATTPSVRLTLRRGGTIYGRVSGLPPDELSKAMVFAAGVNLSAAVDPSGNYRIEGAREGKTTVMARVTSSNGSRTTPAMTVDVSAGAAVQADLEFGGFTVTGRVTKNGTPVEGARVMFASGDRQRAGGGSAMTDAGGTYVVEGLERGEYRVLMMMPQSTAESAARSVEVTGPMNYDIALSGTALRGAVLDAATGEPLAGAIVRIEGRDSRSPLPRFLNPSAVSDIQGVFAFDSVDDGSYSLTATKEGYGPTSIEVTISGGIAPNPEIRLTKGTAIVVRVIDGRDGRQIRGSIRVTDLQGRTMWEGMPQPDSDGNATLQLGTGTYRLRVYASGYAPQTRVINVPGPEVTVAMTPGGEIVIESTSAGMARLLSGSGEAWDPSPYSNGDLPLTPGVTTLRNIAPGSYTLVVTRESGEATTQPVEVREGQQTRVKVE
ncbi:MAG: carboxypeptidase regulatory-like domain-containing protein [Thermoanaerobaculia bacterium]